MFSRYWVFGAYHFLISSLYIEVVLYLLGQWLNFKLFWDYIFSREKVQTFFF